MGNYKWHLITVRQKKFKARESCWGPLTASWQWLRCEFNIDLLQEQQVGKRHLKCQILLMSLLCVLPEDFPALATLHPACSGLLHLDDHGTVCTGTQLQLEVTLGNRTANYSKKTNLSIMYLVRFNEKYPLKIDHNMDMLFITWTKNISASINQKDLT